MPPCVDVTLMFGFSHLWLCGLNGYGMLELARISVDCLSAPSGWLIHMCHDL